MENGAGNDSRTVKRHQSRFSGLRGNTPSLEAYRLYWRGAGCLRSQFSGKNRDKADAKSYEELMSFKVLFIPTLKSLTSRHIQRVPRVMYS